MGQGLTPRSTSVRWRMLVTPPADGAHNMAVDDALLERAQSTGECVVRVYGWSRPTLSLGRNQTARGHYDLERARALGIDFVRRSTGGRAVLHHREVTYSVTGPIALLGTLRASCARINRLLVAALDGLGVRATVAPSKRGGATPGLAPCFDTPGEGELMVGTRKLVGSAQWRDREALLQHGSILIDDDQSLASTLLREARPLPPTPATLRSVLGYLPTVSHLAAAFHDAIVTLEDPEASRLVVDAGFERRIADARAHFLDECWTWRR